MSAFVTRTRGVDADELEELVKAADLLCARLSFGALAEYKKWYEPELDAVRAALKPFEKEEGR